MFIERILDLPSLLSKKSFFLFGPRATGKSTLIKRQLGAHATIIDLLDSRFYLRLIDSPSDLETIIHGSKQHGPVVLVTTLRYLL